MTKKYPHYQMWTQEEFDRNAEEYRKGLAKLFANVPIEESTKGIEKGMTLFYEKNKDRIKKDS